MKRILLGALCLLFPLSGLGQKPVTLSGYIKDASNGEALIGATIYISEISNGTISNAYGFYSITLPEGNYHIIYKYVGFETVRKEVALHRGTLLDLELSSGETALEEVVVTSKAIDENVQSIEMSVAELDVKAVEKLPAFAGEVDILKSIQLLPGVSTVGEGASGFNVRGGSVGQNLVLLDEAPVYQSSHLLGFFSVFNPDAVKDVKLYKGGIPAEYGGRISSILDVRMKEGNSKEYDVTAGIGTIFSRLAIEGPVKKDKSSFIIAGRRSYGDVLANLFTDALGEGTALYFYDLTAKTNFHVNEKNRIYFSSYLGRDVFKLDGMEGFDWGNRTATFRWNHLYSNKLFSNYSLFYSNYDYGFHFGESEQDRFGWNSEINTYNFKPQYSWFINTQNELSFGGEAILYHFKPAKVLNISDGIRHVANLDERKALEAAVYVGNDQRISSTLSLQYGLRFSSFRYLGGTVYHFGENIPGLKKPLLATSEKGEWETIKTYGKLEPRASFRYQLTKSASVKGSYNRMNQYIHLISNTTISLPVDVWQPSTNNIKPQQGDQLALGYFKNFQENNYETSAEVYYRWTKNQVGYIDGADLFFNELLESQLLSGIGRAYGLELFARKNRGRFTGWLSYTLGKTELKVDGINWSGDAEKRQGNWYPSRFDQRHNLKLAAFYELRKNITLSGNFSYMGGTPTTFPTDRIAVAGYVIPYISGSDRHNFRIPDYHRLDLGISFHNIWRGKKGRSGEDYLAVSIYNLYARKNPFSVYFSQGTERQSAENPTSTSARQLSVIGTVVPAVSYNFKF